MFLNTVLSNPNSWIWCTVKSNNCKLYSVEQRKICCRAKQGEQAAHAEETLLNSKMVFKEEFLKVTFWGRVYQKAVEYVIFFWLVGSDLIGWRSRNLKHQYSPANWSVVSECSHILHPGRGLSSCRTTQSMCQIVINITRGGTRIPLVM